MPLGHGTQLGTICVAIEPNHIHYSWSLFFILQDSANPKKFLRSLQLGRRRRGHELLACVGKSGAAADYHHGGRRSQLQVGPVIFSAAVHNLWHWKPCLHDCVKNFSAHALPNAYNMSAFSLLRKAFAVHHCAYVPSNFSHEYQEVAIYFNCLLLSHVTLALKVTFTSHAIWKKRCWNVYFSVA